MAENKTLEHLPEVRAAVTALSPEDPGGAGGGADLALQSDNTRAV